MYITNMLTTLTRILYGFSIFSPLLSFYTPNQLRRQTNRFMIPHGRQSNNRNYPFSRYYYEKYLKRLNSRNASVQTQAIMGEGEPSYFDHISRNFRSEPKPDLQNTIHTDGNSDNTNDTDTAPYGFRIIINPGMATMSDDDFDENDPEAALYNMFRQQANPRASGETPSNRRTGKQSKGKNFELVTNNDHTFSNVGGYRKVKAELLQTVDILTNYTKYSPYSVRVPKGLIFEGPPGNGKTLLAKALAGEAQSNFIAVSGAEFQEKYVGVGASRIRELFSFASENTPCIIFIDEIDALGKARANDGETSSSERDATLNELLVSLDGFKNASGVFVIGATNRPDMLDPALVRPGRIDKRVYIGNPDEETRRSILLIHIKGKPHDVTINMDNLVDLTNGLSGAQIENLLNEAMLYALRQNRVYFTQPDIDECLNRILVGWQPTDHQFTQDIIDHIAIHELGHAVVGLLAKHHAKMKKVIINLSAPNTPAYTVFDNPTSNIMTREALFEHLMILLAGRIAEEIFYGVSVTTGAINDFEQAMKLAEKMIMYYGMGKDVLYPSMSDTYKEKIDNEVSSMIHEAYGCAEFIIRNSKGLIQEGADMLQKNRILTATELEDIIVDRYSDVLNLKL